MMDSFNAHSSATLMTFFLVGCVIHVAFLKHGEWDLWSFRLLFAPFIIHAAISIALNTYGQPLETMSQSFHDGTYLVAALLFGVYSSMLIYRAFFHRLAGFPGPFAARLSKAYMASLSIKHFRLFDEVKELHQRYGDYVRVGPTEISITDPEAFLAIHSRDSCKKGPWYNVLYPQISLQQLRDRKEHAPRRKLWDQAFSGKSLREYESRVNNYSTQLLENIKTRKGTPFNVSKWFNFYTFDIMGDMAFGESFNLMRDDFEHYYYKSAHEQMVQLGAFSHLVWLFPIFKSIPVLNWEYLRFQKFSKKCIENRLTHEPKVPDIFHWVSSEYRVKPRPSWQETQNLLGDVGLIIVAGSDTTGLTLAGMFYHFCLEPRAYKKLQEEVDTFVAAHDVNDKLESLENTTLSKLEYLQACIDESLRLFPVIPSGLQRMTGPRGLQIGETYIPPNTSVNIPSFVINRDARAFPQGEEFIPERWTTRKRELIRDASIHAPFSTGRFSCVGKQLALMEIRRAVVLIALRYDVSFAPGQDPKQFISGLKDNFTLVLPRLDVIFRKRQGMDVKTN